MNEEVGNQKEGPQIIFHIGDEQVLLRPYVYGWELCWQRTVKDKENEGQRKTIWQGEKYFSTISHAMTAMFEYRLRASDASNLTELKARIEEIRKELVNVYDTTIKGAK